MTAEGVSRLDPVTGRASALAGDEGTSPTVAPPPDAIHLWRIELDVPERRLALLSGILSPDEQARADRFVFDEHRRRFLAARAALRTILGGYLRRDPAALRFAYGTQGKPSLVDPAGGDALQFNLSHSGSRALLGVATRRSIGVDLEEFRALPDFEAITRRFFSTREVAALAAVAPAGRLEAFYRCWTRKEAYLKALGDGLTRPLDRFSVSLDPGEPARLLEALDDPGDPARWSLLHVTPWPGFAGCVAVPGEVTSLRLTTWRPSPIAS